MTADEASTDQVLRANRRAFGDMLRSTRITEGMTSGQLAREMSVSRPLICQTECGVIPPSVDIENVVVGLNDPDEEKRIRVAASVARLSSGIKGKDFLRVSANRPTATEGFLRNFIDATRDSCTDRPNDGWKATEDIRLHPILGANRKAFGTIMRTTRARHGLMTRDLCRMANLSSAMISQVENGENVPSPEIEALIAGLNHPDDEYHIRMVAAVARLSSGIKSRDFLHLIEIGLIDVSVLAEPITTECSKP
jgi:transcriptional regulator with XRE-family HTH domain